MPTRPPRRIVIVGGGFAGAVTAIKLLDTTTEPLALTIVEPREELGRGVAYSTTEPVHLVNGAARIFGLHPDDPDHLVRWLIDHGPALGWTPPADVHDSSPPRWVYGTYVNAELQRAMREAIGHSTLTHMRRRAIALHKIELSWRVDLDNGSAVYADEAVLALGVFQGQPGSDEQDVIGHPAYVANPWEPAALDRLRDGQKLLIVGSSLSMVDVIASMETRGYRGSYQVVSRRGQVVEGRKGTPAWRDFLGQAPLPKTALALLSVVKAERRAIAAAGLDWQGLPLAIRPHVLALWQSASRTEQLRFTRHLRAFWDVTAHRAAPPAFESVTAARSDGRFSSRAGRVIALRGSADGIAATIRWRDTGELETQHFDGVINCRGHQLHDWTRIEDPLVKSLLASGIVRPHATGFGIDASRDGSVINRGGQVQHTLHAIGHPLRGVAWESSSIGEQLALGIALAAKLIGRSQPSLARA